MRSIKFRAWDKGNNQMIYPSGSYTVGTILNRWDDENLMQYTGLKDKNGVEIFEGDICTYIGTNMSDMEIKFENGCFIGEGLFTSPTLKDLINATDFESIEVIGNIYENTI